jgi:signal transduction histidine kinase
VERWWPAVEVGEQEAYDRVRAGINRDRLLLSAACVMIGHLGVALGFIAQASDTAVIDAWRRHIAIANLAMVPFELVILALALTLRRSEHWRWSNGLSAVFSLLMLVFGAVVASVDQAVTPALTPFVIFSIAVPILLDRLPLTAVVQHLLSFGVMAYGLSKLQPSEALRSTNLTNALLVAGVGIILSLSFSRLHRRDVLQQRTIEKQHAAIRAALANEETANRAKSAFLATMSHEIRTPMNGVLGIAEVLLETPLSADQQELVSTISEAGNSLLVLLNDVLDFSKFEAGQLTFERRHFDARAMLADIAKLFKAAAQAKQLTLTATPGPPERRPASSATACAFARCWPTSSATP